MAEQPGSAGSAPEPQGGASSEGLWGLDQGELLVVIGGALLFLVSFVLFHVILRDYVVFQLAWVAALGALVAVWLRHREPNAAWAVPYATILLVLGWLGVAIQIHSVIIDLRNGFDDAAEVIAALAAYAGAVLILVGALRHTGKL